MYSAFGIIIVIFLIWLAFKVTIKLIKIAIVIVAILFLIGTANAFLVNISHNQNNSSGTAVSTQLNNN